jgi:hypothetical protein
VSPTGVPITGNAARSSHLGVEIEGTYRHASGLELSGNLTLSRNEFDDAREYLDATTFLDYGGNEIAGFPGRLANVTARYRRGPLDLSLTAVDTGRQYLDNTEDNRKDPSLRDAPGYQAKLVQPSTVLNGALSLDLGRAAARGLGARSLALDVRGFNLTDLRYETAGYVFAEVPYYYPAGRRSAFVSLRAEF